MPAVIDVEEYRRQLTELCTRGGYREWPRKSQDRHVLLKSATYMLEPDREYSEQEINEHLVAWCGQIGLNFQIDYASLRRHLVDAGYLKRDAAGYGYRLDEEAAAHMFERDVEAVDPVAVVRHAQREIEERKRRYLRDE